MKYVVGFSGGIDSQATALWCRRNFPPEDVILTNADAGGNESPITTAFIEMYSATVHPVVMVKSQVQDMFGRHIPEIDGVRPSPTDPLTFELLAKIKGRFPSTKARFCTSHLKLFPVRRWFYENGARGLNTPMLGRGKKKRPPYDGPPNVPGILSDGYERFVGVRRDESDARANVEDSEYDDLFRCQLHRPIASWTKEQAFQYVQDAGEAWNPLYQMGFGRVGCFPCINSGKEDIRRFAAHYPDQVEKIRVWEASVGRTFFPPMMPPCEKGGDRRYGNIDEIIEWANTSHGGKQRIVDFVILDAEAGLCSNKYGFCE